MSTAIVYVFMLFFDFAILAGATWVIVEKNRSGWWMLLALIVIAGSYPGNILKAGK